MFLSHKFLRNAEQPNAAAGGNSEPLKTKEQIDKQNEFRATQGLAPLPYPSSTETIPTIQQVNEPSALEKAKLQKEAEEKLKQQQASGLTESQIEEEAQKLIRLEADKLKAEQEAEAETLRLQAEEDGIAPPSIKITAKPIVAAVLKADNPEDEDDVDEAILLKQLSKKTGREIKSLDEFINPAKVLTIDEEKLKAEERESAKLNYGLQNKKITKAEIESFIEDSKNPQAVAYSFYAANQKDIDATLTEKEIKENFETTFGLNEEEDSLQYKLGQRQLEFIANNIIAKKHAKYLGLETEYSSFETEQSKTEQHQKDILAKAPAYKQDVDMVTGKVSKITIAGHEIDLSEVVPAYKEKMLTAEHSETIISNGYTLDEIERAMKNSIIVDNIDSIVEGILASDRLKNQAGQRGVIPTKTGSQQRVLNAAQDENRKALQETLGMTQTQN